MNPGARPDPCIALDHAEQRLLALGRSDTADLSIGWWRQSAHLVVPASDRRRSRKALEAGTGPSAALLSRVGITPADLADNLDVDPGLVARALAISHSAPVVVLDGEDANVPTKSGAIDAAVGAREVLREVPRVRGQLRLFRPPDLRSPFMVPALRSLIGSPHDGSVLAAIDGLVVPKVQTAAEIAWLVETLDDLEAQDDPHEALGVLIMIETAAGAAHLDEIAHAAGQRLAGLIIGAEDYTSELGGSPARGTDQTIDWLRIQVANAAAEMRVPAIDGMTVAFPVADPSLSVPENRVRVLDRLRSVFQATTHALALGMVGKWTGHPLQLLAALLASEKSFAPRELDKSLAALRAYSRAVRSGRGVTMIDGSMADAATDRRVRARVRLATALGYLDPKDALESGAISTPEAAVLSGLGSPWRSVAS